MISSLFPLLYLSAFIVLLVLGFQMMQLGRATSSKRPISKDRTGLRTTHPEILDANGKITNEKLLVIHFPDLDRAEPSR